MSARKTRCAVVGDSHHRCASTAPQHCEKKANAVGKTSLILTYTKNQFPRENVPNVLDCQDVQVTVDGNVYTLSIWDIPSQEDYDNIRPLLFCNTDVFILCFSVTNPASYESVHQKWIPDIQRFLSGVPILLVGTKTDLREDQETVSQLQQKSLEVISEEKGNTLANKIGAFKYLECSSMTLEGVKTIFDEVIRTDVASKPSSPKGRRCEIL